LRKKKAKKKEKEEISRCKKDKGRRDIERGNSKDRTRENRYTGEDNSRSIIG